MRTFLAAMAAAATLLLGAPVQAATVHEGSLAGGSFSRSFTAPTLLGDDVTAVTGTGAAGAFDFFQFSLPAGAQTVTFDFEAPQGIGFSYSAGGMVLTRTEPFRWSWDGIRLGAFQLGFWQRTDRVTVSLGESFAGTLRVGLYFTHGRDISYRVSSDVVRPQPTPEVVPLPASGLLLAAALGVAGLALRRRGA